MKAILQFLREMIEGGFIGQAVIATILVVGYVVMSLEGKQISVEYAGLTSAVVAWYFRSQSQGQSAKEERLRIVASSPQVVNK